MSMQHHPDGLPYLFVANKEAGLTIYDISDLAQPSLLASVPTNLYGDLDVMNVTPVGDFVYLALGNHFVNPQPSGLAIVDVSTPASPTVRDFWMHGSNGGGGIVAIDGNYAYLGAMRNGLVILDISDPDDILYVSELLPSQVYPHNNPDPEKFNVRGMVVENDIVYACYDAGGMRIINTVNKAQPVETGWYANPDLFNQPMAYNNIVKDGQYLYIGVDYCGVEVLNVSDTSNITLTGWWNPIDCASNGLLWFSAPNHANELAFIPNLDILLVSTGKSDLVVLDMSDPTAPDSCNMFGGINNDIATWGVSYYQDRMFLSYICAIVPFTSNWTGVKVFGINNPVGIQNPPAQNNGLRLFPNPAKQRVTIQLDAPKDRAHITITDLSGKLVHQYWSGRIESAQQLELPQLASGTYLLSVNSATQRLVID